MNVIDPTDAVAATRRANSIQLQVNNIAGVNYLQVFIDTDTTDATPAVLFSTQA